MFFNVNCTFILNQHNEKVIIYYNYGYFGIM